MAHRAGFAGSVQAPGVIAGIKSWTLTYTVETPNSTDFADAGVSAFIPGITEWNGSFEGFKDGVPIAGLHTEVALILDETQNASEEWLGQAILTSVTPSTDHDGIVSYSYTFQGTGALTVPLA